MAGSTKLPGPELHGRLAGASALDGHTARHFDHAREQPQRGLEAAARRELLELSAANHLRLVQRADVGHDGLRRDDVDALGNTGNRQVERRVDRLVVGDAAPIAFGSKPSSEARHAVVARFQSCEAVGAVAFRDGGQDLRWCGRDERETITPPSGMVPFCVLTTPWMTPPEDVVTGGCAKVWAETAIEINARTIARKATVALWGGFLRRVQQAVAKLRWTKKKGPGRLCAPALFTTLLLYAPTAPGTD